jgi:hypothetical protein
VRFVLEFCFWGYLSPEIPIDSLSGQALLLRAPIPRDPTTRVLGNAPPNLRLPSFKLHLRNTRNLYVGRWLYDMGVADILALQVEPHH